MCMKREDKGRLLNSWHMVCVGRGGAVECRGGSVTCFLCFLNLWYWIKISFIILSYKCGEGSWSANPKFSQRSGKSELRKGWTRADLGPQRNRHVVDGAPGRGRRLVSFPCNWREGKAQPQGERPRVAHAQGEQMLRCPCLHPWNEGPARPGGFLFTAALPAWDTHPAHIIWINYLKYTSVFSDMSSTQWAFNTIYKLNCRPWCCWRPSRGESWMPLNGRN